MNALVKYRRIQLINYLDERIKLVPHVDKDLLWRLFTKAPKTCDKLQDKLYDVSGIIKVPIFCTRSTILDLPDIVEILNSYELNAKPKLFFYLEKLECVRPQNKLGVVLALCSTNRIEDADCKVLEELKQKGVENVLMVALRRGADPTKISKMSNRFIDSGVGTQKETFQFVFNKGHVQMDASANIYNILLFFELAKWAFSDHTKDKYM